MVRIGIIGCGKIAQVRHIPEYEENPAVVIAGFYDLNRQRAEELAKRYQGRAYSSYEEMLDDPGIDAVSVCTANHTHAEISIAALKKGKHVLCEKPMAMNLPDCEAMVRAAKENGKILMVDHNQRFTKAHRRAKKLIDEGEIGRILTFRTCFAHGGPETWSIDPGKQVWFFDKNKAVFGAMADLGIHKTDLISYLTGAKVEKVYAAMATLDKEDSRGSRIGVDDNVICIYTMENGVLGSMTASWTCYGKEDNTTTLYGTRGVMKIYYDGLPSIVIDYRDGTTASFDMEPIQTNDKQTKTGIMDVFVNCILENQAPEIDGQEALNAMRAIFAAEKSAQTGAEVYVKDISGKGERE